MPTASADNTNSYIFTEDLYTGPAPRPVKQPAAWWFWRTIQRFATFGFYYLGLQFVFLCLAGYASQFHSVSTIPSSDQSTPAETATVIGGITLLVAVVFQIIRFVLKVRTMESRWPSPDTEVDLGFLRETGQMLRAEWPDIKDAAHGWFAQLLVVWMIYIVSFGALLWAAGGDRSSAYFTWGAVIVVLIGVQLLATQQTHRHDTRVITL